VAGLATFAAVLALWAMATAFNTAASQDKSRLVAAEVGSQTEILRSAALDYAWWTDAYEQAMTRDVAGLFNSVAYSNAFARILIIGNQGDVLTGWTDGLSDMPDLTAVPASVVRPAIAALGRMEMVDQPAAVTGFAFIAGDLHMVAASYMAPYDFEGRTPGPLPVLIITTPVSDELISEMSAKVLVEDLHLRSVDAPVADGQTVLALRDLADQPVIFAAWTTPAPGTRILWQVAPLIALTELVVILTAAALGRRGARLTRDLVRAHGGLERAARTDKLTGALNRLGLEALAADPQIARAIAERRVGLGLYDIDNFKVLNDIFGHHAGDGALVAFHDRLCRASRAGDHIARIGGDQFVVLVIDDDPLAVLQESAHHLAAAAAVPVMLDDRQDHIRASAGFATLAAPDPDQDNSLPGARAKDGIDALLVRAERAMAVAKRDPSTMFVLYDQGLDARAQREAAIKDRLALAIASARAGGAHGMVAHYQPVVASDSGQLTSVEALLRWTDDVLGPVSPAEFVPVAEASGLVLGLGQIVLDLVCADLAKWPDLRASINVSALEVLDSGYPARCLAQLARAGIAPDRITLELTETSLIDLHEIARRQIVPLREQGIHFAVDDFGAGFASIAYLRAFPFSQLKIDRSFVQHVEQDEGAASVLRALVRLGESFGLDVVVEGVETAGQSRIVQDAGCRKEQGFLHARPMPFDALRADFGQPLGQRRAAG
jgi:diguanylate cyclase (GGDEF)-like protein